MRIKIEFACDNAAFGDDENDRGIEIAECLSRLAHRFDSGVMIEPGDTMKVMDSNGNSVGTVTMED